MSIIFLSRNSLINIILFLLLKLKIFNVEIFKAIINKDYKRKEKFFLIIILEIG